MERALKVERKEYQTVVEKTDCTEYLGTTLMKTVGKCKVES